MLPPDAVLPNAALIGLSSEQVQQLRQLTAPLEREIAPALSKMRSSNDEFTALLSTGKPDAGAVMAKFAQLAAAESEVKALRLQMTLAAKSVLSVEQQQKAASLKASASASNPTMGSGDMIRAKLQRVRDGIARMQREGRDVSEVRALWMEFQKRAEMRHHQLAMKALNDALALVEATEQPARQAH